ncbi:MAG TPA: hypothetical protein ENK39_00465 [Epsilonproteobacteria bacterium]|nr:hypothetical protein [Campylobacterota bacterium]
MGEFFANNGQLIVFLHVLSAIIWVGGMIAMRVAVHPVIARGGVTDAQMLLSDKIADILEPKQRLGITMQAVGRLFNLVMPFIVILFATGLIMAVAMGGHHGASKELFITKEILWTIMAVNYGFMYYKRATAWKMFNQGKVKEAKARMKWMANVLLPLNIVLGLVALWMGVALRGI